MVIASRDTINLRASGNTKFWGVMAKYCTMKFRTFCENEDHYRNLAIWSVGHYLAAMAKESPEEAKLVDLLNKDELVSDVFDAIKRRPREEPIVFVRNAVRSQIQGMVRRMHQRLAGSNRNLTTREIEYSQENFG